jgi:hypothetical protein
MIKIISTINVTSLGICEENIVFGISFGLKNVHIISFFAKYFQFAFPFINGL